VIRLGTLLPVTDRLVDRVRATAQAGFESVACFVWEHPEVDDFPGALSRALDAATEVGLSVSALSAYGNPLDPVRGPEVRALWATLVEAARGRVPVVSGFAGREPGRSVDESIPAWREVFGPLADRAQALGVGLAFENCRLGDTWKTGKWNLAINPDAWNLMFAALDADNLGLEWEPCHQIEALVDPSAQLTVWAPRVLHVHGKDARTDPAALKSHGLYSPHRWHRSVYPGEGDTDWGHLMTILESAGYRGAIDLEAPPTQDPAQQATDEARALAYLRRVRPKTEFHT